MSRIRGIETRAQKDVLLQSRAGRSEVAKKTYGGQASKSKDDTERQQISDLLLKLPKLDKIFEVHRKIGEGTFSSVYLGSLRQHAHLPDSEKRWFAIKHLVPTAHPARIEHELRCLQDMGGREHVIGVELCLRHLDTIVFIMPYIPHRKFSEYVGEMDAPELQRYMRALLTALRHVHSFGVIHRDVKPSNFLYEREKNNYFLVDFGLAQRMCARAPAPPPAHCNGLRKRPREELGSPPDAKRAALDLSLGARARCAASEPPAAPPAATDPLPPTAKVSVPKCPRMAAAIAGNARVSPGGARRAPGATGATGAGGAGACACWGAGALCGACSLRAAPRAPRAGTQGFRPPEVLLKCPSQSTAVDMWAAGVVLASALSARYPFLRAADDVAALAELADLLGTAALQDAALALGRRIIASSTRRGLCLRKLCARLRGPAATATAPEPGPSAPEAGPSASEPGPSAPEAGPSASEPGPSAPEAGPSAPEPGPSAGEACVPCQLPRARCLCRDDDKKATEWTEGRWIAGFPDAAFALAARLLDPRPDRRISAADALAHPFITRDWSHPPAS